VPVDRVDVRPLAENGRLHKREVADVRPDVEYRHVAGDLLGERTEFLAEDGHRALFVGTVTEQRLRDARIGGIQVHLVVVNRSLEEARLLQRVWSA
jgi:hypothetical protein